MVILCVNLIGLKDTQIASKALIILSASVGSESIPLLLKGKTRCSSISLELLGYSGFVSEGVSEGDWHLSWWTEWIRSALSMGRCHLIS